jgi:hypothetical protein
MGNCPATLSRREMQEIWAGILPGEICGTSRREKASGAMCFTTGKEIFRIKKGASGMKGI